MQAKKKIKFLLKKVKKSIDFACVFCYNVANGRCYQKKE